jgi:hypothetical protein
MPKPHPLETPRPRQHDRRGRKRFMTTQTKTKNGHEGKPPSVQNYNETLRAAGIFFDEDAPPPAAPPPPSAPQQTIAQPTPTLADAALYGLAGKIVQTMAPKTEAHPAALLGSLLVTFGAAVGRGAWMTASGTRHHANLSLCIVGDSSRARKTTAANNVRELFARAEILPPMASGLSTGEGIIHHIRDPRPDAEDEGITDKRLFVLESELARALAAMKREGNSLSAVLREAWDGSPLRTLTKRDAETCAHPHVSILAAVTREELKKRLDENELLNGFGNRVLWVLVQRPHLLALAGELPWQELTPLLQRLSAALSVARDAGELHRSQAADARWCEIYEELAATNHSGVAGCLTDRAEAQVLRLGMIFALLDCSRIVEPAHLDAALAFWRYCEASVLCVFGGLSKDARNVKSALDAAKPGELSRDEISLKIGKHIYGERLDAALAELAKDGHATSRREETGGRPKELWRAL